MDEALYRTPVEALERNLRLLKRRLLSEQAEVDQLESQRKDTITALEDFIGEVSADRDRTNELIGDYRKAIKRLRGRVPHDAA